LIYPARKLPDVQVAAVAARAPARARAFAARYKIPRVHAGYEGLINDPEIDAVYNPLPNSLHCTWTLAALKAGKHVLCEKPLASNTAEAERMAQTAADTGRILVEAFHYRYHPLAARMKAIVDGGELGPIRHLEAHFCTPSIRPGNIRLRYDLGGGATMDLGCYTIHMLRFLAGAEPEVVQAQARTLSPQVDRWMEAGFRFADGRTGSMTCSLLSLDLLRLSVRVVGDFGELRVFNPILPHFFHRLVVDTSQGRRSERIPGEATYTHQLRAFVQAVRRAAPMPTDGPDAIANMRVIDAVYEKAGLKKRGL
jgi:predicted dehydrogenase